MPSNVKFFWIGAKSEIFAAESIEQLLNWPNGPDFSREVAAGNYGELPASTTLHGLNNETGEVRDFTLAELVTEQLPDQVWSAYL